MPTPTSWLVKNLCLLIIIITSMKCISCDGQTNGDYKNQGDLQKLSHIQGVEQFSISCGIVRNGWNISAGYGKYLSKELLFITGFTYETINLDYTTLDSYYISPEVAYSIAKFSKNLYADIKAGVILGEETMSNKIITGNDLDQVVFGEKLGLKLEYFLTSTFSVNADLEQRFINNSKAGTLSRNGYLSIAYNF